MQIVKLNQHAYSYISKFVVHSQSELIMYRIPATQRRLRYRCLIMKLFMARPPAVAGRCKRGSRPSTYVHACQINARVYMPRHIMPLPDLSFVFLFACAVVIRGNCLYSFRTSHCWRKKKKYIPYASLQGTISGLVPQECTGRDDTTSPSSLTLETTLENVDDEAATMGTTQSANPMQQESNTWR